jgi:Fic family protein
VLAAHFSTFIEGNRLTLEEARRVIADERAEVSGRERDVSEVRSYWNALLRVEEWARKNKPLTEELIRRLHALVEGSQRLGLRPIEKARTPSKTQ